MEHRVTEWLTYSTGKTVTGQDDSASMKLQTCACLMQLLGKVSISSLNGCDYMNDKVKHMKDEVGISSLYGYACEGSMCPLHDCPLLSR